MNKNFMLINYKECIIDLTFSNKNKDENNDYNYHIRLCMHHYCVTIIMAAMQVINYPSQLTLLYNLYSIHTINVK